jgi:hypothetical protein
MNKRIAELARELGPVATIGNWGRVEWSDNVYPQLGDKMYAAIDLQKFAELIVLECAEINKQELAFNALERLLNRYEEHFGAK